MKEVILRIQTSDDGRADIRDFEDLHCLVRAAASDGHECRIEQLALTDFPVETLVPLVQRVEDEHLLPTVPVATVGELLPILLNLPPAMPLSAVGADSGGYDQITGQDVFVDIIDGTFHIAHVDSYNRREVAKHNEWAVNYERTHRND